MASRLQTPWSAFCETNAPDHREEVLAEMTAGALVSFVSLKHRGKSPLALRHRRSDTRRPREHGVTEAADIQDVVALGSLRRTVRLDVDADQLRRTDVQTLLVRYESLPLGQYARRTLPAVRKRSVSPCTHCILITEYDLPSLWAANSLWDIIEGNE